jgi:hypothetical protein
MSLEYGSDLNFSIEHMVFINLYIPIEVAPIFLRHTSIFLLQIKSKREIKVLTGWLDGGDG